MDNLEISWYANPKFNKEQMKFIREALESNQDVSLFANPDFTLEEMEVIYCSVENDIDIFKLVKKMKKL